MWLKAKVSVMEQMHEDVPAPVERIALPIATAGAPSLATVRQPVPIPLASIEAVAVMTDDLRRQYAALSQELGIAQPGLLKDEALAFFRDRGTRIYDAAKVKAFLDDQYGMETSVEDARFQGRMINMNGSSQRVMRGLPTWGWRALRTADCQPSDGQWGDSTPELNDSIWAMSGAYSKPLPLPVLLTVKEVVTKFQSAHFYVSDEIKSYEHRDPVLDPFLLVIIEGERFIIERWDEPGYRE